MASDPTRPDPSLPPDRHAAGEHHAHRAESVARDPTRWTPGELLLAVATTIGATFAAWLLEPALPVASLALVYLCGVLLVAVRSRTSIALLAALLSFGAYNLFFTEPRLTLRIQRAEDIVAVIAFLAAALVVGPLAGRQRSQVLALRAANEQAAERARLLERLEAARVESETERLRSALLASVSHDLRSPLSAVIGAASSLSEYGDRMPPSDRRELLESIRSEGERLDRYIQNLLDMTRLGSGPLKLQRDWIGFDEVLDGALTRVRRAYPQSALEADVDELLPPLHVHAALIEQALFNVLENAVRYSPPATPIRIRARSEAGRLRIEIVDAGPGIPEQDRERVFDLFFTTASGDRAGKGGGLGLAIVRGMIGAHGGSVEALSGEGGVGTTILLTLPLVETTPQSAEHGEEE